MTETRPDGPAPVDTAVPGQRPMARAFAGLRIFVGLVFLSNAYAKATGVADYDWGFIRFNLITSEAARFIADGAARATDIGPLAAFYQGTVLPNWDTFGPFLIVAELAIGLGLLFGVATRLAALGGLLLLVPIWLMILPTGRYLWEYPAEDILPLTLLALIPAGRVAGLDRLLAPRLGGRWPF